MHVLRSIIVVLFLGAGCVFLLACTTAGDTQTATADETVKPDSSEVLSALAAEPMHTVPRCNFRAVYGRTFQFPFSDPDLARFGYVLWRRAPRLLANPLSAAYAGRRGKLTGVFLNREGERWFEARLDDCSWVYALDTSIQSQADPIGHLEAVGRVFFLDQLQFAQRLRGWPVRIHGSGLEPNHRLYTADPNVSYPLRDGQLLEILDVETYRFGHTKGLGGFYLVVRASPRRVGLIKFHAGYIRGLNGRPLWPPPWGGPLAFGADEQPVAAAAAKFSHARPEALVVAAN